MLLQFLKELTTGRVVTTSVDAWATARAASKPVDVFGMFPDLGGFHVKTRALSELAAWTVDDVPRTDAVDLTLRYTRHRRVGGLVTSGAFPVPCRCGTPFTRAQRVIKGGMHPIRISCENPACTREAVFVAADLEAEMRHWIAFDEDRKIQKEEMKSMPEAAIKTTPAASSPAQSKSTSESNGEEGEARPSLKSRFEEALREAPVRGVRMLALDEGKSALIALLKSNLDSHVAEPAISMLNTPAGEGAILALLGAATPYATKNPQMHKLGDEFLKEGVAKGAHQIAALLAVFLKPALQAVEEKLTSTTELMGGIAERVAPAKKRVDTAESPVSGTVVKTVEMDDDLDATQASASAKA